MDVDEVQEREMAGLFGLSFSPASGSWRRNFLRGDKKNSVGAVDPYCTCEYAMDWNGMGQ